MTKNEAEAIIAFTEAVAQSAAAGERLRHEDSADARRELNEALTRQDAALLLCPVAFTKAWDLDDEPIH